MTNEMANTAMLVCTGVLFVTVLIGGTFAANAASVWLRNRREERDARERAQEARQNDFAERERDRWVELLAEREGRIEALTAEVARLTRLNEISSRLLETSERERLGDDWRKEAGAC